VSNAKQKKKPDTFNLKQRQLQLSPAKSLMWRKLNDGRLPDVGG
jgi:hypothetical protein